MTLTMENHSLPNAARDLQGNALTLDNSLLGFAGLYDRIVGKNALSGNTDSDLGPLLIEAMFNKAAHDPTTSASARDSIMSVMRASGFIVRRLLNEFCVRSQGEIVLELRKLFRDLFDTPISFVSGFRFFAV
jgi:hypothetical protein